MSVAENVHNQLLIGTPVNPGLPVTLANLVSAQFGHESNGYQSNVFLTDNNLNGYKWVGSRYQERPGLKSPEGDNYGHYRTVLDSAQEMVDWIYRRVKEGVFPADLRSIQTPEQYAQLLKSAGYYGDSVANYTAGLKRWLVANYKPVAAGGGILVLALFGLIILARSKKK